MQDSPRPYSIQQWLESCPQGYLAGTVFGHGVAEREPELITGNEVLREESIRSTVQLVVGERCALAASAGLINATPDEASKRFLATQTLDEARHVEIFTQRLYDLGVAESELDETIHRYASPNLLGFAEVLLEKVDRKDFVAGVVGQNIILEGAAVTVFEMLHAMAVPTNAKLARTLAGAITDERRHMGFGESTIGELVRRHPEKKTEIAAMQRDMSHHLLGAFADALRGNPMPAELRRAGAAASTDALQAPWRGADLARMAPEDVESVLAAAVLKELKTRLARIGIEYHGPVRS